MEVSKLKQRITGAIVLAALAVIFIPALFSNKDKLLEDISLSTKIPTSPAVPAVRKITEIALEQHKTSAITVNQITEHSKSITEITENHPTSEQPSLKAAKPTSANPRQTIAAANAWVIQVGGFNSEMNANTLVLKLRNQKITTFSQKINGKKPMIKVFVGPYAKYEKAKQQQQVVLNSFHIKGKIVKFEV